MTSALRIIFAGTPEFAATILRGLTDACAEHGHTVIAIYTQPDRPAGRGRKLQASPVKAQAQELEIPVYQPENFKHSADLETLQKLNADLMIVVAYGLLLPPSVLAAPRLGCINIHASLLPRWRGAAPIQRAILAGDSETGITIMQMNEGLDTGDMLLKLSCTIDAEDTGGSLHDKLAILGSKALLSVLKKVNTGELQPQPQDESQSSYATKLSKKEASIDWAMDAHTLARQVRAFNPWPVTQTRVNDKVLRIQMAEAIDEPGTAAPGTVIACSKAGIDIATGNGLLRLKQLQPPGKKAMDTAAFLNGYADLLPVGTCLSK